jgi:hypothetical protein
MTAPTAIRLASFLKLLEALGGAAAPAAFPEAAEALRAALPDAYAGADAAAWAQDRFELGALAMLSADGESLLPLSALPPPAAATWLDEVLIEAARSWLLLATRGGAGEARARLAALASRQREEEAAFLAASGEGRDLRAATLSLMAAYLAASAVDKLIAGDREAAARLGGSADAAAARSDIVLANATAWIARVAKLALLPPPDETP